jgi:hypothetical protein
MTSPEPTVPSPRRKGDPPFRRVATGIVLTVALAGCASDAQLSSAVNEFREVQTEIGIAPDAVRPDPAYETFLGRVQKNCPDARIGSHSIRWELLSDPAFLDLTSRFYNGIISRASYVDALSGSYNARSDSPGIACILQQMPSAASPPPSTVPPVITR